MNSFFDKSLDMYHQTSSSMVLLMVSRSKLSLYRWETQRLKLNKLNQTNKQHYIDYTYK